MKKTLIFLLLIPLLCQGNKTFRLSSGRQVVIACDPQEAKVVHAAIEMFCGDYKAVFATRPGLSENATDAGIIVGTLGTSHLLDQLNCRKELSDNLSGKKEAFRIAVIQHQGNLCLLVAGSDKRGTAYGLMEISRMLGVSPWEWWADSHPSPRKSFQLPVGFRLEQSPAVEHRGIFLNDEDWGLTPWSYKTHEPSQQKGEIGPRTHERIFQLLLRLKANTFWPAMHECSVPFYFTPGNREMADKYGIFIGTSHCEPMMRNTNGEWKTDGEGEYDYVHNRENVLRFWEKRVREVAGLDNMYTLGMRGVHDGKMQGAKTIGEQKNALTQILADQRKMLAELVNPNVSRIPQVFIPYKEVLDVYHAGLQVPEDITLMWCDDNYGYIRHFPDAVEKIRQGGNGIYYHISYWGRPHDYLWLSTTHPALICNQMTEAFESGTRKLWILNVGDIKPAEYLIELFMDMAWDAANFTPERLTPHLSQWLEREFGPAIADGTLPIMQEYYRLAYICKPEFLGNTRVEERDPRYKIVSDMPWSEQQIRERLADYQKIADRTVKLSAKIPAEKQDAWFQLIKYPVLAANEMNKKMLYAQLARHAKADWQLSHAAYDSIIALTQSYNSLNNGKWQHIMDYAPRGLPVFKPVEQTTATKPLPEYISPVAVLNGTEFTTSTGNPYSSGGLGYAGKAVVLPAGSSVTYRCKLPAVDSIRVTTCLVPTHPVNGKKLRYQIKVDNDEFQTVEYQTRGRSEEWKQNVLRNQAIRTTRHTLQAGKKHSITIKAIDEGVIVDQVRIVEDRRHAERQ